MDGLSGSEGMGRAAAFEIRLFGPPEALLDGEPLARLRTRKGMALLALLALRAGRAVDRDWLAATLWPESPGAQAQYNLRRSLSDLRHALGRHAERLTSPTPRALQLDCDGAFVDVAGFDAAVARGDEVSLREAVALYRGPLVEGSAEEWVQPERAAREQAYLRALQALAAGAMSRGEAGEAARWLRTAATVDPLNEAIQRSLMEALAAGGRHAAAIEVYRDLRLLLHRELNAAPSPETAALFERIQAEARQSDLLPPSARRSPVLLRIPHPLTPLVGREEAVVAVREQLSGARLVTLTGPGGVGKTRLAVEVALHRPEECVDGACFVDLAALPDPRLAAAAVAIALGRRFAPEQPLEERLLDYLEPRSLLLLLDNCEHLVEECARLVRAILSRCPRLRVLVTSREPLGLSGEVVWTVAPLPVGDGSSEFRVQGSGFAPGVPGTRNSELAGALWAENLERSPAVRLLIERTRTATADIRLGARDLEAAARICRAVDGLPLAIELAAARTRALSLPQIAERLASRGQSLGLLTSGNRGTAPRQQTLRATLDWSYDLLDEAERVAFRWLSVFAGGFTLEAAEAVCGNGGLRNSDCGMSGRAGSGSAPVVPPIPQSAVRNPHLDVPDLLSRLVDKSLVGRDRSEEAHSGPRFRLLETVRQYALERLAEAGEEALARDRHARYFLNLVPQARSRFGGIASFRILEAELANIRVTLDYSLSRPELAELAIGAAMEMYLLWTLRGDHREVRRWWERVLDSDGWLPWGWRARALRVLGLLALFRWDFENGARLLEEATLRERAAGESAELAWTLLGLAGVGRLRGEPERARRCAEEGLALAHRFGDSRCVAGHLIERGWLLVSQGAAAEARQGAAEALTRLRAQGDPAEILGALHLSGAAWCGPGGDPDRARAELHESLDLCHAIGDPRRAAWVLNDLGNLARREGDLPRARALFEESLATRRGGGDTVGVAGSLSELAFVAIDRGACEEASPLLAESVTIRRQLEDKLGIARMLLHLGTLARHQGDLPGARQMYAEGLTLAGGRDHPWISAFLLLSLGLLELQQDGHEPARTWMEEAVALWQDLADPQGIDRSLHAIARWAIAPAGGELTRSYASAQCAARLFGAAQALLEEYGPPLPAAERTEWERALGAVARALGEAEFRAAEAEGRGMALDDVIMLSAREMPGGEPGKKRSRCPRPLVRHETATGPR